MGKKELKKETVIPSEYVKSVNVFLKKKGMKKSGHRVRHVISLHTTHFSLHSVRNDLRGTSSVRLDIVQVSRGRVM